MENDLAVRLGVSRQPVREALQRMHTEGWVDLRPALGAFVHIPTQSEADQLLAARSLLEAESARLAAERATPEQIEHLWELQRVGEKALFADDQEVLVAANASLHTHIVSMSGNKVLADLRGSVEHRVRWYYLPIAQVRSKDAWVEHAELIEAIASRDAARASDLMRKHTERTREIYQEQRRQKAAEGNGLTVLPRPPRNVAQSANVGVNDRSATDALVLAAGTLRPGCRNKAAIPADTRALAAASQ